MVKLNLSNKSFQPFDSLLCQMNDISFTPEQNEEFEALEGEFQERLKEEIPGAL